MLIKVYQLLERYCADSEGSDLVFTTSTREKVTHIGYELEKLSEAFGVVVAAVSAAAVIYLLKEASMQKSTEDAVVQSKDPRLDVISGRSSSSLRT